MTAQKHREWWILQHEDGVDFIADTLRELDGIQTGMDCRHVVEMAALLAEQALTTKMREALLMAAAALDPRSPAYKAVAEAIGEYKKHSK